jgi:hypothetical protein
MIERVETAAQIDRVAEIGRAFHEASIWRGTPYIVADARAMVASLVSGGGAVWASERGICGVALSPLWFNLAEGPVAVELFWYSADGQGAALRIAAETWAAERDAAYIQVCGLVDEREAAIRRRMRAAGYEAKEIVFMKGLRSCR